LYNDGNRTIVLGERKMQQEFLVLADGAEAVNGKIHILGGGIDRHQAPTFPTNLRADLALSFLVAWGETNRKIDLKVRVLDEDNAEAFAVGGEVVVGRPPQAKPGQDIRTLIAIRGPFPMAKPGAYKAVMYLDDTAQEPPFRFWVEQVVVPVAPG
jgi:hypothetical protein